MSPSELLHFSREPLTEVRSVVPHTIANGKPAGLWVSAGAAWLEWCVAESFGLSEWKYVTHVRLVDNANVLRIESATALSDFHSEWAQGDRYSRRAIPWEKVGERYDGIIISPYQWSHRLDGAVSDWYYGWDVASGCIWNARAVASLESTPLATDDILERAS